MIAGTGIDLVEIARLKESLDKHKNAFVQKIFTSAEIEYCEKKRNPEVSTIHYAGRFAAKEALFKALGTGWQKGVKWKDIEVLNDSLGKPVMTLKNKAREIVRERQISNIHVSISHTKKHATAFVILEKNNKYNSEE